MAALTITTPLATGNNANSSSISVPGSKVGLSITTDRQVTLKVQVSRNGTTWFDYAMAIDATPTPVSLVLPIGNFATVVDCAAWGYFRVNIANASGANAALTVDAAPI